MKLNDKVEFSVKNGMSFTFNDEGNVVVYKANSLSGKESVIVNDQVVSESKNYKKHSTHQFEYNEKNYTIELIVNSLIKGDVTCNFSVENKLITAYKLNYIKKKTNNIIPLFVLLLVGVLGGVLYSSGLLPKWALIAIIAAAGVFGAFNSQGNWECSEQSV
ncbi:hypothetical protein [Algibacillus agarilyticus]|uniref:hypothetical protein n=1 Tax=Algibacillus agarilyticus TaxID=2234133 RepID=UPI000DD0BFC6|nr:hypothetical protein [Algibacillus agarilyticus]